MKERKLLFAYGIALVVGLTALIGFKVWEESPSGKYYEACEDMDRVEPHYDADGYFIMISTEDGVIGTYFCNRPLHHYRCRVHVKVTTPQVTKVDMIENIGIGLDLDDLKEIYETIPEGTPLLIY
jgi:hypothetical protein